MSERHTPLIPVVGVGALSSPLEVGADGAPQAAERLASLFDSVGFETVRLDAVGTPRQAAAAGERMLDGRVHAVAFAATSWYEDYLALDALEVCHVPVVLWSLPGMETGALCGSQQLTAYLKQLEHPYCAVYGSIGRGAALDRVHAFLRAAALHRRLRRARIGFGGGRCNGMTEIAANEFALKRAIGPRVVPLDIPKMLERAQAVDEAEAVRRWDDMKERSAACRVSDTDGVDAMRLYAALREIVAEYDLDALAVSCYPNLMGRVCLPASLLADDGIPFACEGDVNGAAGQLMLTWLTGGPTHNTDWLEPMPDETVVFSHCGSGSFSLAERPEAVSLESVRLMNTGACALFTARPGPVTLVNLLASGGGYQCTLLQGEAVSTEMVFPGNPLRVKFPYPVNDIISWIHTQGIGHHWMAAYGDSLEALADWALIAGPPVDFIRPMQAAKEG